MPTIARGLSTAENFMELQGSMNGAIKMDKEVYYQHDPISIGKNSIHPCGFKQLKRDTEYTLVASLNQILEVGCSACSEPPQPRNALARPLGPCLFKSLQCCRKNCALVAIGTQGIFLLEAG